MQNILVIGSVVMDFVFATDQLPEAPRKYQAHDVEIVGGGCAANAAVAISRLGGKAYLGARLGQDLIGNWSISALQAEGVCTDMIQQTQGGISSFSSVYVDKSGERQLMNFRGANLTKETHWIHSAPAVDCVLVDTRWPDASMEGLKLAKNRNVPGVVDGEAPIDLRLLDVATHVAFSRDGLFSIASETTLAGALAEVSSQIPIWMCATDGENGTYYAHQGISGNIPAFPVEVVDTLGAGDVWHGAFALALAEGQDELNAVRFSNATAALKCTKFGGRKGSPNRIAVEKLINGS